MKIDAHQHFWQYEKVKHSWISPQMKAIQHDFMPNNLHNILLNNAIDGTIAVQVDQTEDETAFLLALANEYSFIKGVVGWVNLQAENIGERLEYFSNFQKLKGFRHIVQSEPDPNFLLQPKFLNGISKLEKYNFTYDILIYENQLNNAIHFVRQFPNQKFILNHIAKPKIGKGIIKPWADYLIELAKYENVYCKISGLVTENEWNLWAYDDFKPYLDVIFEAFGTDRLVFGSDWPVCMLAASYEQVIGILADYIQPLTNLEKDNIWGQNAIKIYNL